MNEKTDIAVLTEIVKRIERHMVSKARFRPVEMITYGLTAGVMFWVLNQLLETIETARALI